MAVTAAKEVVTTLQSLAGSAHASGEPETRQRFAIQGVVPACVVNPASPAEVAEILRAANSEGWVVAASGGHTQQHIGGIPERVDIMLRTERLSALEHYDPDDLTVGVGAGMTLSELQQKLGAHRQFLPLDPANPERSTIGGVMATSSQGPLQSGFGGVREFCIGIKFVTADGKLVKGGGRVVKNVAGYDLMKLLIGSYGTLGIIVSANFKVFPRAQQTRTWVCGLPSAAEAIRFRDRVRNSALTPICLELASPRASEFLPESDLAESDLNAQRGQEEAWRVLMRVDGSDAVLARYRRELEYQTSYELEAEAETAIWKSLSNFEEIVMGRHQNAMILHISLPATAIADALSAIAATALHHNFFDASIGRIAEGPLAIAFIPLSVDPPAAMQYANAVSELRGRLPAGASVWVVRCPREAKIHFDLWGAGPTDLEAMRAVKRAMDPKNILNRGRFLL